jgi:predicted GNAT superfamily acetyltransferase
VFLVPSCFARRVFKQLKKDKRGIHLKKLRLVMPIEVRPLKRPEEFRQAIEVQRSAWGMPDLEVIPTRILIAISRNSGIVLGAFDGGKLVGYSFGFLARDKYGLYLYSHHTGVVKEYEGQGVGFLLKAKQRECALKMGLSRVKWTFDPLQSRNSYFNFTKLGAVARVFYPNYYGELFDELNYGLPTDRVVAEWFLRSRRVESRVSGRIAEPSLGDARHAIEVSKGKPVFTRVASQKVLVRIPLDINGVKARDLRLALAWRLSLRRALQLYFRLGYIASHYVKLDDSYGAHVLVKKPLRQILEDQAY